MSVNRSKSLWILLFALVGCEETASNPPRHPAAESRRHGAAGDESLRAPCTATVGAPDRLDIPGAGQSRPVVIRVGDVICMAQDASGDWEPVAHANANTPHLEISIRRSGAMTMMTVKNATPSMLQYRAVMKLSNREGWLRTSVVPVFQYLRGIESWVDPIESVAVFGLELSESPQGWRAEGR